MRGGVFVQKIVIQAGRAIGVEAESGGKVFTVAADRVLLSAGALKSPHLLMLSGIGPADQLQSQGRPRVVGGGCVGDAAHSQVRWCACNSSHDRRTGR